MFKGILSTIYIETKRSVNLNKINNIYKITFRGKQFVKIKKVNTLISTNRVISSLDSSTTTTSSSTSTGVFSS